MNPAKTAQPIEMLFALRTRVGSRNHVLDGGPDPPMERGNFDGSHCEVKGHSAVNCANSAEPIETPFGLWAWMAPGNRVLDQGPDIHRRGNLRGKEAARCKV